MQNNAEQYDVFLSYNSRDAALVEPIGHKLREAGLRVFLDRWYLVPGQPWPEKLESLLEHCGAVAVFIGPSGMGAWQQREKFAALSRQNKEEHFPVIPVMLPGADAALGFIRQMTWVDFRAGIEQPLPLQILAKAIKREPPGPDLLDSVQRTQAGICPYRGLQYFREEDAAFFKGREEAVKKLRAMLAQRSLFAVVGASGSGKSSVVRAGLVPKLRGEREAPWDIVTIFPGERPLYNLAAVFAPLLEPDLAPDSLLEKISNYARGFENDPEYLRNIIELHLKQETGTQQVLLIVDQFEELYTLTTNDAARQCFLKQLLHATQGAKRNLSVVLTMRGDFVGHALSNRALSDRLQDAQVNLGPMSSEELRAAIEEPAKLVHMQFEQGLVKSILDAVGGEPGNLPLLEFVLKRLWEEANAQGGAMTHAAYEAMGELSGALANTAEGVFAKLSTVEQQAAKQVFLQLVRPAENATDTRRRASYAEIGADKRELVQRLADERLLVTGRDAEQETVEVAHEALIRHWDRLKGWLNDDREFLLWRERLRVSRAQWLRTEKDGDALLRGALLAEAERWLSERAEFSADERAYVTASITERNRRQEIAEQQRAELLGQKALADQRLEEARSVAGRIVFILDRDLQPVAGASAVRRKLLDEANQLIERLQQGGADDPESLRMRWAALVNRGDLALSIEDLKQAQKLVGEALAIAQRLADAEPSNHDRQRDLSVSYNKLGDVQVAAGQLEPARKAFEQSLAITERLAKADPSNSEWQRDLFVSYVKLGNVQVAAGQLEPARKAFEQGLDINERLAKADPSNSQWQRDLSVSYVKLGEVQVAAGQLEPARKAFEQGLDINERLAKADPSNSEWQRDLSVSYEKLGNVQVTAGQLEPARKAFEQSLAIRERLAKADPSNSQWQRDLSISYNKLGNVHVAAGQLEPARKAFEQGLAIAERLAMADPSNSEWQRDLSVSYEKLGNVHVAAGQLGPARKAFEQSLAIRERLAKTDPSNSQWQRDLFYTYWWLGELAARTGDSGKGLEWAKKASAISERLAKLDPLNATWQKDVESSRALVERLSGK